MRPAPMARSPLLDSVRERISPVRASATSSTLRVMPSTVDEVRVTRRPFWMTVELEVLEKLPPPPPPPKAEPPKGEPPKKASRLDRGERGDPPNGSPKKSSKSDGPKPPPAAWPLNMR